jgi:diguanylate cyclase (GGDEF)-like protein
MRQEAVVGIELVVMLLALVVASGAVAVACITAGQARRARARAARDTSELTAQLHEVVARGDARSALLLGDAPQGWWEYDTVTGEVLDADESWRRLGGADGTVPTHLQSGLELVHPDDLGRVWSLVDPRHEGLRQVTVRLRRPHASPMWVDMVAIPAPGRPNRLLGVTIDVTARVEAEAKLQHRLEHDELTGCSNRAGITRVMRELLGEGQPFALLLVDLDHFTDVNVTLGHPVGDHVLVAVARRFAWTLRRHDVLGRLGSDEFAVIVRIGPDEVDACGKGVDPSAAAAELVEVLDIPVDVDGVAITSRASVGVVLAPDDGTDVDTLLRRADLALQRAKQRGGTWARFDRTDEGAAARRLELSEALPIALAPPAGAASAAGGLDVHFQPIVELGTQRVRSAEALVRWRHPSLGTVAPLEFVGLAERYGMGMQLFRFVLARSLGQLSLWRVAGLLDSVSVNVSPRQLADPALVDVVADALVGADLPPSALTLEITEDALIDHDGAVIATLRRLHELGVRVAIDDFGTGYSSLTNLRMLHVDVLKLDRSFVIGLGAESRQDALVSLAVGTAHRLGLTVVAEGVEDADTLTMLRQHGCDAAQGYHVCRPGTAAVVGEWLSRRAAVGASVDVPVRSLQG